MPHKLRRHSKTAHRHDHLTRAMLILVSDPEVDKDGGTVAAQHDVLGLDVVADQSLGVTSD